MSAPVMKLRRAFPQVFMEQGRGGNAQTTTGGYPYIMMDM